MVYEPLYHALQIWYLYTSAQNKKQAENRLCFQIKSARIFDILWVFLIKQLFHSFIGYKMIIANSYPRRTRGIIVN